MPWVRIVPKLNRRRVSVRVSDPNTGDSLSLTVYGATYDTIATRIEADLRPRYRCTSLSDRRHKRRGGNP